MKKSILVLGVVLITVCALIGCKRDVVYDDVVPGNGKSPIKLQMKNGKYVTADWQYPQFHKEFTFDNRTKKGVTCVNWLFCDTGKDCELILNYNPNNNYYMIGGGKSNRNKFNRDQFREYTVEELETLIGVIPPTVNRAVYVRNVDNKTESITFEVDGTFTGIEVDSDNYEMEVSRGTYFGDASKDGEILITVLKKYKDGNYIDYTGDDATQILKISGGKLSAEFAFVPWGRDQTYTRQ